MSQDFYMLMAMLFSGIGGFMLAVAFKVGCP